MPQPSGFRERLQEIVGKNTAAFARCLDEEPGRLYPYLSDRESMPPLDLLARIAAAAGVRAEWLLSGEGPREAESDDGEWEEVSRIRSGDIEVVVRRRRAAEEKVVAGAVEAVRKVHEGGRRAKKGRAS